MAEPQQSEMEMIAELLGLMQELAQISQRESEIRQRGEQLLSFLTAAIEARSGTPQPVRKQKPAS